MVLKSFMTMRIAPEHYIPFYIFMAIVDWFGIFCGDTAEFTQIMRTDKVIRLISKWLNIVSSVFFGFSVFVFQIRGDLTPTAIQDFKINMIICLLSKSLFLFGPHLTECYFDIFFHHIFKDYLIICNPVITRDVY